eukprot:549598_1
MDRNGLCLKFINICMLCNTKTTDVALLTLLQKTSCVFTIQILQKQQIHDSGILLQIQHLCIRCWQYKSGVMIHKATLKRQSLQCTNDTIITIYLKNKILLFILDEFGI